MSVEASILIKFSNLPQNYKYPTDIIQMLLDEEWTLNDNEGVSYLPEGDDEDFDWVLWSKISQDELIEILKKKN